MTAWSNFDIDVNVLNNKHAMKSRIEPRRHFVNTRLFFIEGHPILLRNE
jgi:hypothetical protein